MFDLQPPPCVDVANGPIAILAVHNEMLRMESLLAHHRSIGIKHFFVVDNGSTDGTGEFLTQQADVTCLPSSQPFKDYKSLWYNEIANRYAVGRWTLFVDADEQFVYPGWPDKSLAALTDHWNRLGIDALAATLVDLYSHLPFKNIAYEPGTPLLDTCSCFDGDSYYLAGVWSDDNGQHPNFSLKGGVRERLFWPNQDKFKTRFRNAMLSPGMHPYPFRKNLLYRIVRQLLRKIPDPDSPELCKIPLLRWKEGYSIDKGAHRLRGSCRIGEDLCTVLHFKFLQDFEQKVRTAVERKQHHKGSIEYASYKSSLDTLPETVFANARSIRFQGMQDLYKAGLAHISKETSDYLLSMEE
ncbi:glycosyltransferase family 2 protein [Hoeflea prorocentri]|uniref:Glycosyltransferase family 2 protein n=1 Tax=Hoeflea prorocentri TaxID=1922333 RepID=A0A9X3ZGP6_9HYPH|nr:glycosyltransferase family 2 protein [Hoeflea prorocentri]MCY6380444.1 glycosyltransferase family 2 protein [Hoeflea prorocentri]MDA5398244.1 glycosyltransferase family 2 protein [Hoeflea prorocentri]